jgi:hypothetical protein
MANNILALRGILLHLHYLRMAGIWLADPLNIIVHAAFLDVAAKSQMRLFG